MYLINGKFSKKIKDDSICIITFKVVYEDPLAKLFKEVYNDSLFKNALPTSTLLRSKLKNK